MNFRTLSLSFILIASLNVFSQENENAQVDLLFLKIQELESEIAELRNIIESQDYLIQKLIKESVSSNEAVSTNETNLSELPLDNNVKFSGIDDTKSKEEIYTAAIKSLEKQDLERASILFKYFVENFNDDEKSPLSYFWLGEIALIENNLDISNSYFLELVSIYPSHYRTPLAHKKKIGDIFLKMNELDKAKDKYNYVIREYPNDTASSLALQLLKNME
jgi:TolA-binding protein